MTLSELKKNNRIRSLKGISRHPLYNTWQKMHSRCSNQKDEAYLDYGGRGIKVCKRWNDFALFISDMGPKPSRLHSLDRIDNNKGYSRDNCRWADQKTQANNMRSNRRILFRGELRTITEVANELGITISTLFLRLSKMSLERALTQGHINRRIISYAGRSGSMSEMSRIFGINVHTIRLRLKSGLPMKEVFYRGNRSSRRNLFKKA